MPLKISSFFAFVVSSPSLLSPAQSRAHASVSRSGWGWGPLGGPAGKRLRGMGQATLSCCEGSFLCSLPERAAEGFERGLLTQM